MRKLALTVALIAVAAGCSHKKPRPPPPPAPIPVELPLVAFESAKLDEFKFSQALLSFTCRVENPNPFPLSVSGVRFAILLEGRPAATGDVVTAFAIPAAVDAIPGRGSITFPVAVRFAAVPGFAKVMALEKEAGYSVTGAVAFRAPQGVVQVPIAFEGTVPIPKMPKVDVLRLSMRSASPTAIVLELRVRIGNTNGFPLPSARLDYGLVVSKNEVARATGRLQAPLLPGESAELVVPIEISPFRAGKAAAGFLIPFKSKKVELKGHFEFDGVPVPIDLDADVTSEK
jgi:LEA14-like dessication related protein